MLHVTSVAIDHIYAMHAMQPNNSCQKRRCRKMTTAWPLR